MAGARSLAAALAAALPFVAVLAPRISAPDRPRAATPRDSGCAVCHPAAAKALTYSVHAGLRSAPGTKDRACTVCHGEQAEHVASAIDPTLPLVRPGAVRADACAACHPGRHLAVAEGAHPWHAQLDRVPEPSVREPAVPAVPPPPIHELRDLPPFGYDLGAAATFGWRFVDVLGSHERYDTDVHLDDGPRLTDLELRADARGDALIDRARLTLTGLGDPWMRLRGELADDGGTGLKGRFARDSFVYRARGDFHRVDVRAQEWGFDLRVPLAEHTEATASFTRRLQNGFWLTNRIGNRNVNPQSTVTGVRSPRDHDADLWEVGVLTRVSGVQVRAGVEYRAHADVDGFHYERPAPSNPGAIESEDFVSSSTLRGPGAHLRLNDDDGAWRWSLGARVLELERRVRGDGFARGFDIAEFTTTTDALARGEARTWIVDATSTWELSETVSLLGDLRWHDHEEDMRLDQVDVTDYPSLGNRSTVVLGLDTRTAQRVLQGSLGLQVDPTAGLRLGAGWGFAREWLHVPDFDPGDADFHRGLIQNDGVFVDAEWRPGESWVLSARYRAFGQNGIQLHEISEDEVRTVKGKVRWQRDAGAIDVFTEHRQKSNDVTSTELDAWTTGGTATWTPDERSSLWASYAYTDLESRTLTTFYFDPSPLPVPTFVGFDGRTHAVSVGAGFDLTRRVRLDLGGTFTSTRGTFAVDLFDWHADLSTKVCSAAELGLLVRQVDYEEGARTAGLDDYGSYLVFVYVRTRVGTAAR